LGGIDDQAGRVGDGDAGAEFLRRERGREAGGDGEWVD